MEYTIMFTYAGSQLWGSQVAEVNRIAGKMYKHFMNSADDSIALNRCFWQEILKDLLKLKRILKCQS